MPYYTYDDLDVLYDDPDVPYDGYTEPSDRTPPEYYLILLSLTDTGYGDTYDIMAWSRICVQNFGDDSGDVVEVYVSNDGENFALRGTVLGQETLKIQGPYKAIKAKHVSGNTRVEAACNRDFVF